MNVQELMGLYRHLNFHNTQEPVLVLQGLYLYQQVRFSLPKMDDLSTVWLSYVLFKALTPLLNMLYTTPYMCICALPLINHIRLELWNALWCCIYVCCLVLAERGWHPKVQSNFWACCFVIQIGFLPLYLAVNMLSGDSKVDDLYNPILGDYASTTITGR